MARKIYGQLKGEEKILLGIGETVNEIIEIREEYESVFGTSNILFTTKPMTHQELKDARQQAYFNLISTLQSPMKRVISTLQNKSN